MEALLFTIDGQRYGVWRDQILSVENVDAVHRLPFLKSSLTVLAVVGDHTRALAELPQCLGHKPEHRDGKASALVMSDKGQLRGFVIGAGLSSREAGQDAVVALPDYLRIPFTESFLSEDGALVPLVAVRALFEQILRDRKVPQIEGRAVRDLPAGEPQDSAPFKLIKAGGLLWAVQTPNLANISDRVKVSRFPLIPSDIDGLAAIEHRLLPVVDVSRRVSQRASGESPCLLEAEVGGAAAVLRVDGTRGQWEPGETRMLDLPPICRKPWMQKAALHRGQIAPIMDLATLITSPSTTADTEAAGRYTTDSIFASMFGRKTVEVHEFLVQGRRWAIPKVEVADVISSIPAFALAGQSGIVTGVAEHDGRLLPVLDLSRIMASTEAAAPARKMILYSNGNFRALIPAQTLPEVRQLRTSVQRETPVPLAFPVVYGCYTEGESVRLILNMYELALHFDESRARDLLPPLAPSERVSDSESDAPGADEPQAAPELAQVEETAPTFAIALEPVELPRPEAPKEPAPAETPARLSADVADALELTEKAVAELLEREPEPARASSGPAIEEKQPLVEESGPGEQAVLARPIHRGWRMLVAFVGSAVLIVGAVVGLHFSGLAHEPQLAATPPQTEPAAQQQPASQPNASQPPVAAIYVVKEGDTLWDISNRLTGNPFNYHSIAHQNRIANPDLIFPGQALQTPADPRTSR